MAYNDSLAKLSDSQALTATAVSTDVYDQGGAFGQGTGEQMAVVINVIVAADSTTGDETYNFTLVTGGTSTPTDIFAEICFGGTNELAETTLTAGYQIVLTVPAGTTPARYLAVNYTLGGTTPSITVSAYLKPVSLIANNFAGGHADDKTII